MRQEMPDLPAAWLRPTGDPEPPANFAQLQHNLRVAGGIAVARGAPR